MSEVTQSDQKDPNAYANPPAKYKFEHLDSLSFKEQIIDMAGHGIKTLGNMNSQNLSSSVEALKMISLNLSNNEIASISRNTIFATSLVNLTLANNKITNFTGIAASGLRNLNLRNNQIATLQSNGTSPFPSSLEVLDLSGNPLVEISNSSLPPSLRELHLDSISTLQSVRLSDYSLITVISIKDTTMQNWLLSQDQFNQIVKRLGDQNLKIQTSDKTKIKLSSCDNSQSLEAYKVPISICIDGPSDDSGNTTIYAVVGAAVAIVLIVVGFLFYRKYSQRRAHKRGATPGVSFSVFVNQSSRNTHMYNGMADTKGNGAVAPGGRPRDPTLLATSVVEKYDVRFDPSMQQFRIDHKSVEIKGVLASGGFGIVHRAIYKGENVAVKQLLPSIDGNSEAVTDFMEEIRLCSMLDHPHIVRFIGVTWTTLKDVSAVIEFMPNGDLANLVRAAKGKIKLVWSESDLARGTYSKIQLLADVAAGLSYLHGFHVIHRDLKAKNVLLGERYEAKLSDFGTSRSTIGDATMTAEVGTIAWIAPEVLKGKKYAESADMYSFGVLLSEVDTGISPYSHLVTNGGSQLPKPVIAMKVMDGDLRPTFTDSCPADILAIANQCLLHDPSARPTAPQVVDLLTEMLRAHTYTV